MSAEGRRCERSEQRTTHASTQSDAQININDNTLRGSSSLRSDSPRSWLAPFFAIWRRVFGGAPVGGELARYLRPLVLEYGSPSVETAFERYCEETEPRYVNAKRFASTFGCWRGDRNGHETVNGPVSLQQAQEAFRKAGLPVPKLPDTGFSSCEALRRAMANSR